MLKYNWEKEFGKQDFTIGMSFSDCDLIKGFIQKEIDKAYELGRKNLWEDIKSEIENK